jgi:mRNA interferase RelE/StbE
MLIILSKSAEKYFERLNEPTLSRISDAMKGLSDTFSQGDIKKLSGRGGYRLRVGGYRVLFKIEGETIIITGIAPRGQAYKE